MMSKATKQPADVKASSFDFSAPGELFGGGKWTGRATSIKYRRFDTAAEAIQYAVEELNETSRRSCVLEVNEKRFNHIELRKLYDSSSYPLKRAEGKDIDAT